MLFLSLHRLGPFLYYTKGTMQKPRCRHQPSTSGLYPLTFLLAHFNQISYFLTVTLEWPYSLATNEWVGLPCSDNLFILISLVYLHQLSIHFQLSTLYTPWTSQAPAGVGKRQSCHLPQPYRAHSSHVCLFGILAKIGDGTWHRGIFLLWKGS